MPSGFAQSSTWLLTGWVSTGVPGGDLSGWGKQDSELQLVPRGGSGGVGGGGPAVASELTEGGQSSCKTGQDRTEGEAVVDSSQVPSKSRTVSSRVEPSPMTIEPWEEDDERVKFFSVKRNPRSSRLATDVSRVFLFFLFLSLSLIVFFPSRPIPSASYSYPVSLHPSLPSLDHLALSCLTSRDHPIHPEPLIRGQDICNTRPYPGKDKREGREGYGVRLVMIRHDPDPARPCVI